jgi:predicted nucleic acid-binding protein
VAIWVSDTSPICYFARLGLLEVLRELLGEVRVPMAVVDEIDTGRALIRDLPDLRRVAWVHIESRMTPSAAESQLGPGETEVLALAESLSGDVCVLLDDLQARIQAAEKGISVRGTRALLVMAKEGGFIQELRPLIERLEAMGFRVSGTVREMALALAGE